MVSHTQTYTHERVGGTNTDYTKREQVGTQHWCGGDNRAVRDIVEAITDKQIQPNQCYYKIE